MKLPFIKMQGTGNDYLYMDGSGPLPDHPEKAAKILSDRRFGVGADGLVLILPSEEYDAEMRMFNADGSEGAVCGNALRCVGKFLFERKNIRKDVFWIRTAAGVREVHVHVNKSAVDFATVHMGKALCGEKKVTYVGGYTLPLRNVSVGNPHAVVFADGKISLPPETIGPLLQNDPAFPGGVNVEFVTECGHHHLVMRVWERGSGETYGCGSGACAAVAAAVTEGRLLPETDIDVRLPGGIVTVRVSKSMNVSLTGNAEEVFEGVVDYAG